MEKTIRKTSQSVINQMIGNVIFQNGSRILEPSAGSGDLAQGILEHNPDVLLDCVELNKELRETLINKGFNVIGEDFLQLKVNEIYDFIIAAPTYKNNIDVVHIMHMFNHLKVGGTIISLSHPAWITGDCSSQKYFREWLLDKDYSMRMLKDNSFVEKYMTQPSLIMTITRHDYNKLPKNIYYNK